MKHRFEIDLPKRIEVNDYHDFDGIRDMMKELGISVKVKEIAGIYEGIIYVGFLSDKENAEMVKQIKEYWKDNE